MEVVLPGEADAPVDLNGTAGDGFLPMSLVYALAIATSALRLRASTAHVAH
jgi:hypothetical protein